jgi:transcriptional regulator with XRE-family HTH domain
MPSRNPDMTNGTAQKLAALGQQIRAHRKALRVSAGVAAEAAGMSRVTLHRIENGEPSVTMGAYFNALSALGLSLGITTLAKPLSADSGPAREGWIPARVRLSDYPQLRQLAWQVQGTDELTPREALGIYERNARHIDGPAMQPHERQLLDALRLAFSDASSDV